MVERRMIANNGPVSEVKMWVKGSEKHAFIREGVDDDDGIYEREGVDDDDGIYQHLTVREISVLGQALPPLLGSRQRQTELLARLAALSEMHAPQEQQQDLKRQQERLQLEGLLAESTAKLAVRPLRFKVLLKHPQNKMTSYLAKTSGKEKSAMELKPTAKEHNLVLRSKQTH